MPSGVLLLNIPGLSHLARALIGRIGNHQVVGAFLEHPHKAHAGRQLLAVQAQAQIITAGVSGQKLLQQILQVGTRFGAEKSISA